MGSALQLKVYPPKGGIQGPEKFPKIFIVRLFIAVFLPENIRSHLGARLKKGRSIPRLRWVPPESLHVTLKFLGEVEAGGVPRLSPLLAAVAARHGAMILHLESGGVFPSPKNPRVCWTGIKGDSLKLVHLAKDLESSLEPEGFPKEDRDFKPHLTVAKNAGGKMSRLGVGSGGREEYTTHLPTELDPQPGHPRSPADQFCTLLSHYKSPVFEARDIHLVQSFLSPQGSRYEVRESFPLRPAV